MFFNELAESHYFLGSRKGTLIIPAFLQKTKNCRILLGRSLENQALIFILKYLSDKCPIIVVRMKGC